MLKHEDHVVVLDKKITELSDALAHLGKGTSLQELLKIIRFPGWTTPAEFAFSVLAVDAMRAQVKVLETMSEQLLAAGKMVGRKG
ncbi:MAG: hypothetical protein Q7U12_07520 [Undibacterium sp.]|jgi:hypothetical protein|nr:hypothetical protein [Undibacterium sp.]MDO8702265.1 hypothetical protein [Undibacterium sp.]MDO9192728.1 hypothetical protein [Undibacterium sp.]